MSIDFVRFCQQRYPSHISEHRFELEAALQAFHHFTGLSDVAIGRITISFPRFVAKYIFFVLSLCAFYLCKVVAIAFVRPYSVYR